MFLVSPTELTYTPKRIVSLVPSQTELLHFLELAIETVGITKFCVRPHEWFQTKQRIGGTKSVDIPSVQSLKPDLIIANKEENVKEQVQELANDYPVWVTDVNNFEGALKMIGDLGALTNKISFSENLIHRLKESFGSMAISVNDQALTVNCCYLIWRNPYMTVGGDTFINDMLQRCGLKNCFTELNRYPEVTIDQLTAANPQLILLSSEPYPFKQQHIEELQQQLPDTKILLVDGEMFSWYGSRLLHAASYFENFREQFLSFRHITTKH